MRAFNKKGFTLAELLIVMAIVVVLAAIAIPTFGKQLETSRETADAETLRVALEDAFTKAFVDYANDSGWTHGATATEASTAGITVASGNGLYIIPIASTKPKQTVAGFAYVTPTFRVGKNTDGSYEDIVLTETAKMLKSTAFKIGFVFAPGSAGNESSIKLVSATLLSG